MRRQAPPLRVDAALADAFCEALDAADFSAAGIAKHIGFTETVRVNHITEPRLLRRTEGGTPVETLIRLLFMRIPVARADAQQAFRSLDVDRLVDAGLLKAEGDFLRSWVQLGLEDPLHLVFDPPAVADGMDADHVMGMGPSSAEVRNLGPGSIRHAADLGTGCGGLALAWSRCAESVVGTDVNPRAIAMSRLNVRLNKVTNVELIEGSLYEPLAGRRFDLISMNPPFVLSGARNDDSTDRSRLIFRDSGMQGDGFCRAVIEGAPAHLEPGGTLRMTVAWACFSGQSWQDRVRSWIPAGHDAWVVTRLRQSASTYVESWVQEAEGLRGEDYRRRFNEWIARFEADGIEAVGTGLLIMRKRPDQREPWFVASEDVEGVDATAGELADRILRSRDFLVQTDDATLLRTPLTIAPDGRLIQDFWSLGEGWSAESSVLKMTRGLHYRISVDARVASLLAWCNGERPLSDLAVSLAESVGAPVEAVTPALLGAVRRLTELGFLLTP